MIEKNSPRKFVADKDQRLLEPGDMIVAENITITERGEGSGSIVKTFKGLHPSEPASGQVNISEQLTVVGKVEDPQTDKVYFFVADESSGSGDKILRYDPLDTSSTGGTYTLVFENSWLNFNTAGFVKADIVNKDFARNGGIQTVIYFTDNNNPPRKINVNRALNGDYDTLSTSELDIALGAMRAAPTKPPTFNFLTDDSVSGNLFIKDGLQYATQIIYTDGEVSALSPYSKLAVSAPATFSGMDDTDYNVVQYTDNTCIISHNIDIDHPDIKAVRLLARSGNTGAFFVVDEFNPTEDLTRSFYGNDADHRVVYDSGSGKYTFYNDKLGQPVADATVNKLYDNVPQKAEGQSVTASRLMYSNYTEGYPNIKLDPQYYSMTPQYASQISGLTTFAFTGISGDQNAMFAFLSSSNLNVTCDLDAAANISGSTNFPAGTTVTLETVFAPEFTAAGVGADNLFSFTTQWFNIVDDPTNIYGTTTFTADSIAFGTPEQTTKKISIDLVLPEDISTSISLANYIQSQLEDIELFLDYSVSGITLTSPLGTTSTSGVFRVSFKFGETSTSTDDQIVFEPRITGISYVPGASNSISAIGNYNFYIPNGDILGVDGDAQNEITYSSITNTETINITNIKYLAKLKSFKQGAQHSFGIVYYDKYGRSGFVNELGSVYVDAPHERSPVGFGAVSMEFDLTDLDIDNNVPSWVNSYQIVYAGSSVSDVFQYTVGGAYPRRLTSDDTVSGEFDIDASNHNIYVSLKTLDQYQRDKEVNRDYSFTEGDKLRIISHRDATDANFVYPSSDDGDIMEFDVVGVETFSGGAPLRKSTTASTEDADNNPVSGTFLVLSAPAVEATAGNSGAVNKYAGFDWNQITATDYNTSDTISSIVNFWNRSVVVEIITPKKATSEKIYYEIGERRKYGGYKDSSVSNFGPVFTISGGDVHFRPVNAKSPVRVSGSWLDNQSEAPEGWGYRTRYVEDESFSDLFSSESWDRGRAHSVYEDAATIRRRNSITYSDAYADDTAVLSLSSFNPTLANFFDAPSEYGACRYIGNISDKLLALQEQKISLIGVEKDVIETGSQAGLISLSRNVLNNIIPFGGDYGTQNPESVLIRDANVFFSDVSRRAILRANQKGLEVLSDVDIQSFVDSKFKDWIAEGGRRLVSGYDPDDNAYYITLEPAGSFTGLTLGYNMGGFWQGTYTFYPTCYAAINQDFIICDYYNVAGTASDELIFRFSNDLSNRFIGFQGTAETSRVTVVSNSNPSMVKQYNSISLEADSAWATTLESSTGQTTASLSFTEKEDAFYANVSGDTSSNSKNQYIAVGTVKTALTASTDPIELKNKINGFSIPRGYALYKNNGANDFTSLSANVSSVDYSGKTVTPSAAVTVAVDDRIFVAASTQLTGDQIRGHYCKIECSITPNSTNKEELYSINANFVNSKANHALSQ